MRDTSICFEWRITSITRDLSRKPQATVSSFDDKRPSTVGLQMLLAYRASWCWKRLPRFRRTSKRARSTEGGEAGIQVSLVLDFLAPAESPLNASRAAHWNGRRLSWPRPDRVEDATPTARRLIHWF